MRQEQVDQAFEQLDRVAQTERDLLVRMLDNPDLVATCVRVALHERGNLRTLTTVDDLSQIERQRYDAIIGGGVSELVRTVQDVNRIVNWSTFHKLYDAVKGDRPWLMKVNSVRWILGI